MTMRVAGTPQRDTPTSVRERDETSASEAPDPVAPSGLHAKLILQHNDVTRRLWISSANAKGRGLAKGNAEIVAELDVGVPIVVVLQAFAEAQALAVPKPPSEEALAVKAADRPSTTHSGPCLRRALLWRQNRIDLRARRKPS